MAPPRLNRQIAVASSNKRRSLALAASLVLAAWLPGLAQANSHCDLGAVLAAIHGTPNPAFKDYPHEEPHVNLAPPGAHSLAAQHPTLNAELHEVEKNMPDPALFETEFRDRNHREPTLTEQQAYFYDRRMRLFSGMHNLAKKYETSAPLLARALAHPVEKLALLGPNPDGINDLSFVRGTLRGAWGEIVAVSQLDHVVDRNVVLNRSQLEPGASKPAHELIDRVDATITKTTAELAAHPEQLAALTAKYPAMFRDRLTFESVAQWIRTKEFDVLRKLPSGKTVWTEVKNTSHEIDVGKLFGAEENFIPQTYVDPDTGQTKSTRADKTLMDQAHEAIELREFLGLKDSVELDFYSVQGVTAEAAKDLKDAGYDHVGPILPAPPKRH